MIYLYSKLSINHQQAFHSNFLFSYAFTVSKIFTNHKEETKNRGKSVQQLSKTLDSQLNEPLLILSIYQIKEENDRALFL